MPAPGEPDITGLLQELSLDRPEALTRLIPAVYQDLRRIAHGQLRHERPGHTLETTALVHEAYLKLAGLRQVDWQNRTHFFAIAGRLMRRTLVDYARARQREKRGGEWIRVSLVEELGATGGQPDGLLALDDALTRLEARNPRQCRVVEYRCFAGLSVEETAEALGTSVATVKRDWAFSRAWLNRDLGARS
jgi:RNA polymerase sigma factor (TIGR02999 family)